MLARTVFIIMIFINSLSFARSLNYSDDIPNTFRLFITNSLLELSQVSGEGASPLHQKIFKGPVHGETYLKWLMARVQKISLTESCNITAKVDPMLERGVIYISKCVNFTPASEDKAYWISILFHEARHLEVQHGHWHHRVCVNSMGEAEACDESPLGAFGVEKIMAANIVKYCQNCSEDLKTQFQRVYDDDIVWRKISPQAIEIIEKDLGN